MYKSIGCQVKTPWPIGRDRLESGTSRRPKEFWERGGTGRVVRDDVRWTDAGTRAVVTSHVTEGD